MLEGKTAIVTGAASTEGIGWATAKLFVDQGARVVLLDVDGPRVASAASVIGSEASSMSCDVRSAEACEKAIDEVVRLLGRIDVLVNNAGVSQPFKLNEATLNDYDIVMDVSMRGTFNMTRAVAPCMRNARSGSIVCTGSIAAQRGGGILGGPHYSAAKGAVHSFTKAVARELAPDGVRCNAIAPGLIVTGLLAGRMDDDGKQRVAELTPLGRNGTPADVANVSLFLASNLSAFVTGCILDVNGGLHIH